MNFNMYVPTKIIFGKGRLSELHQQQMSLIGGYINE